MEEKEAVTDERQTQDLAATKNGGDADELLQKISEVVKDGICISTEDINKPSEKNFLKKIEEMEHENTAESSKECVAATTSNFVIVDGIVMDNTKLKSKNANDDDSGNLGVFTKTNFVEKVKENHIKINMGNAIDINLNSQLEGNNKKRKFSNVPSKIEYMSIGAIDFSNNIKKKEIVPADNIDIKEKICGVLPKKDINMSNVLQEKCDVLFSDISKSKITDTNISNEQNPELGKHSSCNDEQKIISTLEIPKSTDSIHARDNESMDKVKRKHLPISNESFATVKHIIQCSDPSIRKDLLMGNGSNNSVINSDHKLFEIPSENISKISKVETSQYIADEKNEPPKYTVTDTETESRTCTSSESEDKISDGINKYLEICKNGIRGTTTDDEDEKSVNYLSKTETISKIGMSHDTCKPNLETKLDGSYEVNFLPKENDIKYFSVEKIDLKQINSNILVEQTANISSDQSSYGSISSLVPFTLPTKSISHLSEISSTTSTSASQKILSPLIPPKIITHAFDNKIDLCDFVIEHFEKIKKNELATLKNFKKCTSSILDCKRSSKISEEENEEMSKTKSKKEVPVKNNDLANDYGDCVLAKWIDKKYYAGRIAGEKPGSKFFVLFEDGASKILSKDSIVFGQGRVLPLKDHSVYALVGEDDYERGVVVSVEKTDDETYYTVQTDNNTVKITSSDIYLQESQAKIIQKCEITNKLRAGNTLEDHGVNIVANNGRSTRNKRSLVSPITPEAGFSGSAKTSSKRQKRDNRTANIIEQRNRCESQSEVSDTPDDSPLSPEGDLEAIEGVQPEVQRTDYESEICKLIFLSDIESVGASKIDKDILDLLPLATNVFMNKCFVLSCTVGLKPHRYEQTNMFGENYRNRQFSKIPFIKVNLKKQIEAGGGKVYEHFEDIPKSKYRQCKLIVSRPCLTARYIQCLASDIQAISHEWIIDCCIKNRLLDYKKYSLPAGWSITKQIFVKWSLGSSFEKRDSKQPFTKTYILLAAQHKDFIEYWNRVCKIAGAEVRVIKSLNDITASTKGYVVAEMDIPQVIRSKAEHFGIKVVSTVWIVESLILGKLCPTNSNRQLFETFQDDEL